MRLELLSTAAAVATSSLVSWVADVALHDGLLFAALLVLLVQWQLQRRRQERRAKREALLASMRALSEEVELLVCDKVAVEYPELRRQLHIFERAVMRALASAHHGRAGAAPLCVIQRYVRETAPTLLAAVKEYGDPLTLQGVCRHFQLMSQRLLPQSESSEAMAQITRAPHALSAGA